MTVTLTRPWQLQGRGGGGRKLISLSSSSFGGNYAGSCRGGRWPYFQDKISTSYGFFDGVDFFPAIDFEDGLGGTS